MPIEKIVGIVAGVLTSVSMLPQFIKLIKKKDSKDIAIGTLVVLITGVAGWVGYGVLRKDIIIIATNAFAFLINVLTIAFALKYRK